MPSKSQVNKEKLKHNPQVVLIRAPLALVFFLLPPLPLCHFSIIIASSKIHSFGIWMMAIILALLLV